MASHSSELPDGEPESIVSEMVRHSHAQGVIERPGAKRQPRRVGNDAAQTRPLPPCPREGSEINIHANRSRREAFGQPSTAAPNVKNGVGRLGSPDLGDPPINYLLACEALNPFVNDRNGA